MERRTLLFFFYELLISRLKCTTLNNVSIYGWSHTRFIFSVRIFLDHLFLRSFRRVRTFLVLFLILFVTDPFISTFSSFLFCLSGILYLGISAYNTIQLCVLIYNCFIHWPHFSTIYRYALHSFEILFMFSSCLFNFFVKFICHVIPCTAFIALFSLIIFPPTTPSTFPVLITDSTYP